MAGLSVEYVELPEVEVPLSWGIDWSKFRENPLDTPKRSDTLKPVGKKRGPKQRIDMPDEIPGNGVGVEEGGPVEGGPVKPANDIETDGFAGVTPDREFEEVVSRGLTPVEVEDRKDSLASKFRQFDAVRVQITNKRKAYEQLAAALNEQSRLAVKQFNDESNQLAQQYEGLDYQLRKLGEEIELAIAKETLQLVAYEKAGTRFVYNKVTGSRVRQEKV